ncbi:ABC transporter substrate-binding protein [Nocardiopsis sp. RSe5-2]|uniref:ABC transporter substrate-binding protein n=1 Tax=Nocardiopsis endophytica TaxID=3018445 RepID=A0ABT4U8V4_9ACTN|nr:ABC transporter substrate-binding protein [Nocardiopsis endophytica]MDA2813383.1 ABC transporter substrate-binding protein [Nocardiopsis endophytica]
MRHRLLPAAASAAVLILALSACGDGDDGGGDGPRSITVGAIPIVDIAPLHLAVDQGIFADHGIEVEIRNTSGGAQAVPGVASGDFDFAFGNVTSLLVARDAGLPMKVVANGVATTGEQGADFGAVVVPEGSPIESAEDLEGATVAVNNLENIGDTTVRNSVRKAGGDPSQVEFMELALPDMPPALEKEEIDAAWVVEPFLTTALEGGATEIASNFVDAHPKLTIAVYFTSERLLAEDPELAADFASAMEEALAYAAANPEEVRRIVGEYTEIDPTLIEEIRLPQFPPETDRESVQTIADLMEEDGLVDEAPDVDALFADTA